MVCDRRQFVKMIGLATVGEALVEQSANARTPVSSDESGPDPMGVLVDISNCIGCRRCEFACQQAAGLPHGPIESYDDASVFAARRRTSPQSYTVVNRFADPSEPSRNVFVKLNCLHCIDPPCASACLVGALRKQPGGAVTYDANKCIGCRYCMVACPLSIPTYDYHDTLTPQVRKCDFCFANTAKSGGKPACVQICPRECLTFGPRSELLRLAHEKIERRPDQYVNHIYGEHEIGGTSWMFLSGVPFESLGLPALASQSPAKLTETLQHAVFRHWIPPLLLYGLLVMFSRLTRHDKHNSPTRIHHDNAGANERQRQHDDGAIRRTSEAQECHRGEEVGANS